PTLSMLRDALMEQPGTQDEIHAQARMKQMHDLIELMTGWLADVQKMDSATLVSLMKMGAKVQKLLQAKDKMASTVKAGFRGRASAPAIADAPPTALSPEANDNSNDKDRS
ncbi:MAG: transcriptional regulator, ArsR family, partial [Polaromonas sp.]|nr:transcriptional regulator, ArsR family [Polaromonas sp.]